MGLFKCVHNRIYRMSDDEIKNTCGKSVGVLYGFNSYGCDLTHINELKNAILNDYPDIKDEDIEVWYIQPHQSDSHARHTMLRIRISTEDFIKLRANKEIYIL